MGAFPNQLLSSAGTGGVTPWGGVLNVCAWTVGTNTACATPANSGASQYFAIEFTLLSYQSCIVLATRPTFTTPSVGLFNVNINAVSIGTIPVTPLQSKNTCTNTNTNTVDFIYSLRPPVS